MSFADSIKGLIYKQPDTDAGRDASSRTENPYLTARRSWNDHVGGVVSSRQTWQIIGILSMLVALASVGGMIHIGSQSKFIPYVVEVDKSGQTVAIGPLQAASRADPRVIHASIAEFIIDARTVTPDMALQSRAVFRVYAKLAKNDPATQKMNEWLNGSPGSDPFQRAETQMVDVEIKTVIPQTPDTWQVEWIETTRDRQGIPQAKPAIWRALVTVYLAEITPHVSDEELRKNPLSLYVRDFSWARVQ